LELIDQLPSTSRYYEAVVNHPEHAEEIAKQPEPEEPWHPRQAEFGLNERLLAMISDQLQQLNIGLSGSKQQVNPYPRPKTLVDEVKDRLDYEWAKGFIQRLGFDADDI
jgi:hypothetical protein